MISVDHQFLQGYTEGLTHTYLGENVPSSHIQLCSFGNSLKPQGMLHRFENLGDKSGSTIVERFTSICYS